MSILIVPAMADNDSLVFTSSNSTSMQNAPDSTATTVTPNPATFTSGNTIVFTATVTDISNPSSSMIGIISWSDGGAGGIFSPDNCILENDKCAITYTPPSNLSSGITITASYAGDASHSSSSGTASLSAPSTTQPNPPTTTQPTPSNPTSPSSTTPSQDVPTTPSTTQSNSPTTTQSNPPTSKQPSPPTTTQPTPSNPTSPSSTTPSPSPTVPSVHQIINLPEEIFDKVIRTLENIFQKI